LSEKNLAARDWLSLHDNTKMYIYIYIYCHGVSKYIKCFGM